MESRNIFNVRRNTINLRSRWLLIGLSSSATIIVLLIVLPLFVQQQAIAWLEQNGAEKAKIEDIDINLFTGRVSILNMEVSKRGEMPMHLSRLMLDMDWWPLFSKKIFIKQIELQGLDLFILHKQDEAPEIGGIVPAAGADSNLEKTPKSQDTPFLDQWGVGLLAMTLDNVRIHYKSGSLNEHLEIKHFSVANALSWIPEQQTQIEFHALINNHPFNYNSKARLFQKTPDIQASLELSDVELSHYSAIVLKSGIKQLKGKLSLTIDLKAVFQEDKQLQSTTRSNLIIADFQVQQGNILFRQRNLHYIGDEQISYPVNNTSSTAATISVNSMLGVSGIQVDDIASDIHLTTLDQVNAENLHLQYPGQLRIGTLTLQQLKALQPIVRPDADKKQPVAAINKLQLDKIDFQFKPQVLELESLALYGMHIFIQRESDGTLYGVNAIQTKDTEPSDSGFKAPAQPTPEAVRIEEANNKPFQFAVNTFSIGNDSSLHFIDNSVQPPIDSTVSALKLNINSIDNTDIQKKTTIDLSASINKGSKISLTGWLVPFAEKRDADINATVKALDLVNFSSYISNSVGYQIKSGRINANFHASLERDKIRAKTKIVAQRLNLESLSKKARSDSAKSIGVPLDSALSLMKDSDENIAIEIPINGNLDDPEFDTAKAIRSALSEAIKKGSIAYAAYALQPYGSILLGARMLSAASSLRLESVYFDAGSADINRKAGKYLNKIATLMKERPGIAITLCGKATPTDKVALQNQTSQKIPKPGSAESTKSQTKQATPDMQELLNKLAIARGDSVRNRLIGQYKIAAGRIFDCQPEVSNDETSKPEVSLGL